MERNGWMSAPPTRSTRIAPSALRSTAWPCSIVRCGDRSYAIEDRCTHDGEPFEGGGSRGSADHLPAPWRAFLLATGEALTPPAYEPVRTFKVRASNGVHAGGEACAVKRLTLMRHANAQWKDPQTADFDRPLEPARPVRSGGHGAAARRSCTGADAAC